MLAAMIETLRELWAWGREHAWTFFLATVAAYAQLHYDLYGPPAHLVILPSLALITFLVLPTWAAVIHDSRDRGAMAIAGLGMALAMAPALVWAYHPDGEAWLKADARPLALGAGLGTALVAAAMARGNVPWGDWGLGPGDVKWWSRPIGGLLLLIVIGIPIVVWTFPEFAAYYPRYKPGRTDLSALMRYEVAMGVYMLCWESFFRGFMLFGLARTLGPVAAIVIQAYPFFLLHDQKPEPEMISSWFGGLAMGWLCWRARSALPSFLLHWVMYMTMELTAFAVRNLK